MEAQTGVPTRVETVPTRVEPGLFGLRASIAHGPEKGWSRLGLLVTVSITAPAHQVQWLRLNGYVLSRVFQEAASRLMGGNKLDEVEREIQHKRDELAVLEATKRSLLESERGKELADSQEKDRLERLNRLAEAFFAAGRDSSARFTPRANLNWISSRLEKDPVLNGSPPEKVLELVLKTRQEAVE